MQIPLVDLNRQYHSIKDRVDNAVHRVLDSGRLIGGPETEAFEQEFGVYCDARFTVAVASGTSALSLTLRALGVGPDDEVITSAFTLSATLDAIVALGARPVLIDVDPITYTMDPTYLAAKTTKKTKAILPVHIYGHPADMDSIIAYAEQRGIPVVADACEAHGASYKGRNVGSIGTAACFSFYPTKNLGGIGDAGAVTTNDVSLAERVRRLRQHGWDRRYHSIESSLNSRMAEIQAAVLREKLFVLDSWNGRRRAIARRYDRALADTLVLQAPRAAWARTSYYLYVVRTPRRDALAQRLTEVGVGSDIHWPEPPHLLPAFKYLGYWPGTFPVTESLCNEVLSIPIFPQLTRPEVDVICDALTEFSKALDQGGVVTAREQAA